MSNEWGDAPVSTAPPPTSWGDAEVVASPYSVESEIAQRQALVQSIARRRQLREETDAAALVPKVFVGINAPFGGDRLATFRVPEELAAFGSEAIKSSPSTAAGLAAASGVTPLASRLGAIPGPVGLAARFGIPLVAGGVAAIGTRFAQDRELPQILPETARELYQDTAEIAGRNPTSAMLGQIAGSAPFFRPGLPVGTQGLERLTLPVITGGIGGAIEGANQLREGQFDPQRLAIATAAGALMNRETRFGRVVGPNLVLPSIDARAPAELGVMRDALREPVLPEATAVAPSELDAMRQASVISANEGAATRQANERSVANLDAGIDAEKVRRLGERMAGKSPEDQLAVLDQELRLQKDTLTTAEQRAGLDMKLLLQQQIDQQKALEQAAKAQQDQAKAAADAQQQAQDAAAEAAKPPEVPQSAQILADSAKPPPLANVATEIATQTKQSPFALQGKINELTAVPEAQGQIVPPTAPNQIAAAGQVEPVNIGDRSGRPTGAAEEAIVAKMRKDAGLPEKVNSPKPEKWVRGESQRNANGDLFFSTSDEIAGDFGEVRPITKAERPKNTLTVDDKPTLAGKIGYTGDPLAEPLDTPVGQRFDTLAKSYAKQNGYDSIRYENGTFGEPELHVFRNKKPEENQHAIPEQGPGTLGVRNETAIRKEVGGNDRPEIAPAANPADQAGNEVREGTLSEPLARSAEQRLNDADLGMKPVSAMTRQEKRAELDAAGIKTYNGKPLDAANPAEISAAVGKLRRGQLGSERGSIRIPGGPKQTETPAFKKWFGESKVVDAEGKPLVVYHGTAKNFDVFDKAKRGETGTAAASKAFFFSDSPDVAANFSGTLREGAVTVPSYLSLENPIIQDHSKYTIQELIRRGHDLRRDAIQRAIRDGRDGVIFRNTQDFSGTDRVTVYAAFDPTQIKSAIGNRGIFDPTNPDIRAAISPRALAPLGGSVAGGAAGYLTAPEQQPGESDEEYHARLLQRTLTGAAIGGAALGLGAMSQGARARQAAEAMAKAKEAVGGTETKPERVTRPTPGEGQGVRQLASKVIEDTNRTPTLRQSLADNPEIIYDKFLLGDLNDRVMAATPDELTTMRGSSDRNERAAATIELANRAASEGRDTEAAALYADASTQFTNSAQLLNVAKLVRSPIGYVTAIKRELADIGRATTAVQDTQIAKLGADAIKADQRLANAERLARDDFSPANQKAFEDARTAAAQAGRKLADYVSQIVPKGFDDIIIQTIQGNLLTPLSQIANVYGNILFQPVRRGAMSLASGLDAIYSKATGLPRVIDRTNPLPRAAELEAFADGTKVAAKELLTGPSHESYVKGEVQRGFRPIRSLVQSFTGENMARNEAGGVALTDRAKKFIEGTLGVAPETMFRLLNLGDRGFRRAAEVETLLEQARLRGLKGRDLEKFLEFPDRPTQALLNTEARKAIFAQENQGVNQLNAFLDTGIAKLLHLDQIPIAKGAIKVFGRLNVPFRQFPVNYVMTALNFAVPELALAKGLYYSSRGDRRKALSNIGEGLMGSMMYGAAAYLWQHGLISEPVDKDAKRRSIQYDNMGGQRINLSGLKRSLEGGDPTWRRDDTTVDWGRMGIPAPVFYVYTQNQGKESKALQQTGVRPAQDTSVAGQIADRVASYPGIGQFALDQSFLAGSSAFLEALKNGFTGPEADAWAANMFRATSTLAVPNTVEALARAEYQYIPELRGDTLGETFKNIWDFKTFQLPKDDRALLKRDIWGAPIARTPPNQNPYVYQFLDVTKTQERETDPFKAGLVRIFNESNNPGTYPTPPDRNMTVNGVTVKLEPKDYETLQGLTGRLRREEAEPMVLDPEFNTIPAGERVAELEKVYSMAATDARNTLLSDENIRQKYFGEVYGGKPGERVVKRNTQARNRLEQQTPEETVPENPFGDKPAR